MPEPKLNLPQDIVLALAIARQVIQFLADEKARTGMSDEQIIVKYTHTFDANEADLAQFLRALGEIEGE
jgi:hypothetical protein